MSYYNTTITPVTTGNIAVNCGFQPVGIKITVSMKNNEAYAHLSIGQCDNTWSTVHSIFQDTTGGKTYRISGANASAELVAMFERVGGTITKVNSARLSSFTATGVILSVLNCNAAYQYNVELFA